MFLDDPDASHILDVLVKLRIDSHVLRADSEALFVFILICDADDEGNTRWVLLHHIEHEANRQVDTLDDDGLVASLEVINDLL